jgi:hypothetical protein
MCHSTVDDSFAPGIGHRLDGWANQDLNVGAIVALAPNLQPVADLLNKGLPGGQQVDVPTVQKVLHSWGPGRFDAELFMDGKAFGPGGSNASTLIPDAFGLAGVNAHTWTGNWGTVTYWNAFVANLEMHGSPGTFFDGLVQTDRVAKEGFTPERVIAERLAALVHQDTGVVADALIPGMRRVGLVEKAADGDGGQARQRDECDANTKWKQREYSQPHGRVHLAGWTWAVGQAAWKHFQL